MIRKYTLGVLVYSSYVKGELIVKAGNRRILNVGFELWGRATYWFKDSCDCREIREVGSFMLHHKPHERNCAMVVLPVGDPSRLKVQTAERIT